MKNHIIHQPITCYRKNSHIRGEFSISAKLVFFFKFNVPLFLAVKYQLQSWLCTEHSRVANKFSLNPNVITFKIVFLVAKRS